MPCNSSKLSIAHACTKEDLNYIDLIYCKPVKRIIVVLSNAEINKMSKNKDKIKQYFFKVIISTSRIDWNDKRNELEKTF